ncbi:hypothetical protein GQ53DRAFT_838282 [Thozetella sp. PMI_491]|nr:hypothetical protein GQ53DRAFT_838282 [Thozetella sp. PMI_491]
MSSARRDSLSTMASEPKAPEAPIEARAACSNRHGPHAYPQSSPGRRLYVLARSMGVIFSLILIVLSAVVFVIPPKQPKLLSPILNVALPTFFASGIDLVFVLRANRRAHPVQRLFHDGALAIGTTIATGFTISFSVPIIMDGWEPSGGLSLLIWLFMISLVLVHAGISAVGLRDSIEFWRRPRQVNPC